MEITRSENDGTIILAPSGRIDQDSSAAFQAALSGEIASTPPASVVVDFTAIEYISSVGLRALMIGAKESKANGGKLAVAALCPVVQEVFQIVRRHIIWNNLRPDLKEDLAHLV
ncbi:MAG: STAS domain-containing protein, partial [Proteobacteria bacterium]|nr:STAS domain-containing protein [Pseudomonadota bacterium]